MSDSYKARIKRARNIGDIGEIGTLIRTGHIILPTAPRPPLVAQRVQSSFAAMTPIHQPSSSPVHAVSATFGGAAAIPSAIPSMSSSADSASSSSSADDGGADSSIAPTSPPAAIFRSARPADATAPASSSTSSKALPIAVGVGGVAVVGGGLWMLKQRRKKNPRRRNPASKMLVGGVGLVAVIGLAALYLNSKTTHNVAPTASTNFPPAKEPLEV